MDSKHRIFSFPYNGSKPEEYLRSLEPFRENIYEIYIGLPNIKSHIRFFIDYYDEYNQQSIKMLDELNKNGYRFSIPLNSRYELQSKDKYKESVKIIKDYLYKYNVPSIICAEYRLAKDIREDFPNIDICTSCNGFQYSVAEMKTWDREIGIHLFNPPRTAAKDINYLKHLKEHNFKLKVLVNEQCYYGCPEFVDHALTVCFDNTIKCGPCNRNNPENYIKGTWVLPRWLTVLDPYVDVWKIHGRYIKDTEWLINTLKRYINSEDCYLEEICRDYLDSDRLLERIHTSEIPDKLLYCKCENCDTCKTCRSIAMKHFDLRKK